MRSRHMYDPVSNMAQVRSYEEQKVVATKKETPVTELQAQSTSENKSISSKKSDLSKTTSQKNANVNANGELITAKQKWCADKLY